MKNKVRKFINDMPYEIRLTYDKKPFILIHAGVDESGAPNLNIREKFYMTETKGDDTYIFGHTTTKYIRLNIDHVLQYPSTIWKQDKKIGIDCGAPYEHGRLACLRLNDMAEFYVDNNRRLHLPLSTINKLTKKCVPNIDDNDSNNIKEIA